MTHYLSMSENCIYMYLVARAFDRKLARDSEKRPDNSSFAPPLKTAYGTAVRVRIEEFTQAIGGIEVTEGDELA